MRLSIDRARWWGVGLVALAFTLSASPVVARDQIVSTSLVDLFSSSLLCVVSNVGSKPVTVKSVRFLNEDGAAQALDGGNCSFPGDIFPSLSCYQAAQPPFSGQFARCEVVVKGGAKALRVRVTSYNGSNIFEGSEGR